MYLGRYRTLAPVSRVDEDLFENQKSVNVGPCTLSGKWRETLIIHNDIPRYHQKLHVAAVRTEVVDEFGS